MVLPKRKLEQNVTLAFQIYEDKRQNLNVPVLANSAPCLPVKPKCLWAPWKELGSTQGEPETGSTGSQYFNL